MERLNAKLYEKYRGLKKRKLSEGSEWAARVETELEKYRKVVQSTFEEMQNESNQLRAQVSSMEGHLAECRLTLMEETRKVKELSAENEKLQKLLSADHSDDKIGDSMGTPNKTLKAGSPGLGEQMVENSNTESDELQHNIANPIQHDNHRDELLMLDCCRRNLSSSGDGKEKDCANCAYQMLVESLVGMKVSVESQTDGFCLSAVHQSSGYSFSLTWTMKTDGEEGEIFYRVSSLGTIERVATEWMKEDVVFSVAMCRVFFQRISRIIGGGLT